MSNNEVAFLIGLFGSVHCIGMCGPLAFAVPTFGRWWLVVSDKLLYNIGRVVTYSFLGLLIGMVGRQLWLAGAQQWVSLVTGGLIIMAGLSRLFKIGIAKNNFMPALLNPFNRLLTYALQHRAGHLIVGLLNGFLPCGFVYLALAGAVNTPSPLMAAQYMFWFGMGTFPLMLAATLSAGFVGSVVRRHINRAMPYLMVCLGFWFVLRGIGLDIPYLSPAKQTTEVMLCH